MLQNQIELGQILACSLTTDVWFGASVLFSETALYSVKREPQRPSSQVFLHRYNRIICKVWDLRTYHILYIITVLPQLGGQRPHMHVSVVLKLCLHVISTQYVLLGIYSIANNDYLSFVLSNTEVPKHSCFMINISVIFFFYSTPGLKEIT